MKSIILSSLFVIAVLITSCSGKPEAENAQKQNTEQAAGEEDMVYACPMHPEVKGKKGEQCSECGMYLQAEESKDGHTHDDTGKTEHNH